MIHKLSSVLVHITWVFGLAGFSYTLLECLGKLMMCRSLKYKSSVYCNIVFILFTERNGVLSRAI